MDADQDGLITQEEWQRVFANHDENGDNRLSKSEIESIAVEGDGAGMPDPDQERLEAFSRLDLNGNNAIDSPEWPGKDEVFSYMDANQNGSLSREEFLSRNGRFWNQPFENLDFDEDGIIENSEWLDSDKSFDRLDRDRNGMIERREFYNPR
jgi:Ca2+-binding EF-hand superfamily protein